MPPASPVLLKTLCEYWGLSPSLERQLWQALFHAKCLEASSFRQMLAYVDVVPNTVDKLAMVGELFDAAITPERMMTLLEGLVLEGRMSRLVATQIEEHLLRQVDATGAWCVPKEKESFIKPQM
jgi:hypothetical protein